MGRGDYPTGQIVNVGESKMEPEIPKPVAECRHWFQFVNRVDASHIEQVCRKCKKVIFAWKEELRDIREDIE
jgi:hypothetical protein